MSSFSHLVRFESEEDGAVYFADLGPDADGPPSPGAKLSGAKTIEALAQKSEEDIVTVRRVSVFALLSFSANHSFALSTNGLTQSSRANTENSFYHLCLETDSRYTVSASITEVTPRKPVSVFPSSDLNITTD